MCQPRAGLLIHTRLRRGFWQDGREAKDRLSALDRDADAAVRGSYLHVALGDTLLPVTSERTRTTVLTSTCGSAPPRTLIDRSVDSRSASFPLTRT
eukprot:CAMPEP_0180391972 /NCGR_PEP_ID=MMETSP0989-20121125/32896_1 /TAXON_ID=697907 /ORGANISM="non described non described, Strain CCMP2293" /LENGTH=95 /DNA_ID=CAMNT_0022393615 /DNA_START=137 /DNA_END=421 /DNA_ORIENTATION=-